VRFHTNIANVRGAENDEHENAGHEIDGANEGT